VAFERVRSIETLTQPDGPRALTVEVQTADSLLREVLVAHVKDSEEEALERLIRVLKGAIPTASGQ
jgi:hypothetical protein